MRSYSFSLNYCLVILEVGWGSTKLITALATSVSVATPSDGPLDPEIYRYTMARWTSVLCVFFWSFTKRTLKVDFMLP